MNWGWSIVLAFAGFMVFIGYLAVRSFQTNVDLVTEDYYQQELEYQQQIEKISNARRWNGVTVSQQDQLLVIQFPKGVTEKISGTVSLFRPSDARLDSTTDIALNGQQQQRFSIAHLPKGYYRVKIDWATAREAYYSEKPIYIQ